MEVYAFVGPSGTGKSYRAQFVAGKKNIKYIIDDGLLICENEVIAGTSAKKASTKIETVKDALFSKPERRREIQQAIKKYKPDKILILGTSDSMVAKIAETLGLPEIKETIYIESVATPEEMEIARRTRITNGTHVIPVPTFEIKKDFSGYLLDPLQIFKTWKNSKPYISEKSVIRPTFSYMGNFQISDTVFRQIVEYLASKSEPVHRVNKVRIDSYGGEVSIYMEIIINYGYNIKENILAFKNKCRREIEKLTSMNIEKIDIIVKGINVEGEK